MDDIYYARLIRHFLPEDILPTLQIMLLHATVVACKTIGGETERGNTNNVQYGGHIFSHNFVGRKTYLLSSW